MLSIDSQWPAQGPEIAIAHSEEVLAGMNPWCIEHHSASGLTQRCRESNTSMEQAEEQVSGQPISPMQCSVVLHSGLEQ